MVFNSFTFAVFFPIVYGLYLLTQGHLKLQNRILLLASCIFYGWWDWRFLILLFFTVLVDFYIGQAIHITEDPKRRKGLLIISIVSNLGILGFFKYFNFFTDSFGELLHGLGFAAPGHLLNVVLPVGISFYTFQSMSYTIDVYRRDLVPVKSVLDFALYVTYFPQLVAGPIERATHLIPQVLRPRKIRLEEFYEGCYLIFWGLFKKVFVADNLARIVDPFFASSGPYHLLQVILMNYVFAFQIYCDFGGYSDIARGLGKCMGFDIMVNFNLPYFATNPIELWKRWHISLATWFRDYVYIPMGGNKKGTLATFRNLFITFLLVGFWHGAHWNFILWGAYQGLLLIVYLSLKPFIEALPKPRYPLWEKLSFVIRVTFFFQLWSFSTIFFRSRSLVQVVQMLESFWPHSHWFFYPGFAVDTFRLLFFIALLAVVECFQYLKNDLAAVLKLNFIFRAAFYVAVFYLFIIYGANGGKEFIYFQF